MKIGVVAKRSGLTVKTIRFYSDEGLIQPSARSGGGYRLFREEVFAELNLIRTLKSMDIPLDAVAQILASRRSGVCSCDAIKVTLVAKAGEIEEKISALRSAREELDSLLNSWKACGGSRAEPKPFLKDAQLKPMATSLR